MNTDEYYPVCIMFETALHDGIYAWFVWKLKDSVDDVLDKGI